VITGIAPRRDLGYHNLSASHPLIEQVVRCAQR
jgi:hypothetical protein